MIQEIMGVNINPLVISMIVLRRENNMKIADNLEML